MKTHASPFLQRPASRLGWWATGLATACVVMSTINPAVLMRASEMTWWRQILLPFYGIFMLLCGLAGGIVGLVAILKKHERSWLVWLTLLPGAFVVFFLLGEFLIPH